MTYIWHRMKRVYTKKKMENILAIICTFLFRPVSLPQCVHYYYKNVSRRKVGSNIQINSPVVLASNIHFSTRWSRYSSRVFTLYFTAILLLKMFFLPLKFKDVQVYKYNLLKFYTCDFFFLFSIFTLLTFWFFHFLIPIWKLCWV